MAAQHGCNNQPLWHDDEPADLEEVEDRIRVLVAEDDPQLRRLMADSLRLDGYDVDTVTSGYELARVMDGSRRHPPILPPDLVVSDVRMPGLSGLEVLEAVRSEDWSVPFIMVTAFGDALTHAEAKRLGASVVVDKPFSLQALRNVVRGVLYRELGGTA